MVFLQARRVFASAAMAVMSAALGAEPDERLSRPPVVWATACDRPAVYHSENWNPRALAFLIMYDDSTADAQSLTERLARRLGFVVLDSGPTGFSARWLEPRQVAALRCISEVKLIEFVLPVQLLLAPNNALEQTREG